MHFTNCDFLGELTLYPNGNIYQVTVAMSSSWRPTQSVHGGGTDKVINRPGTRDPDEFDENGARLMSRRVVQQLLRSSSGTYVTPQYNTTLYLNSER